MKDDNNETKEEREYNTEKQGKQYDFGKDNRETILKSRESKGFRRNKE